MNQLVMRALVSLLMAAAMAAPGFAAPPDLIGYWVTGKNQAVTQIYGCGEDMLCGELVGFPMDNASDAMPVTWSRQPQCHFVFIRYLRNRGDNWKGTIINPRNGNSYGVAVRLAAPDQLRLRGYVLMPLLGATQFWNRYDGPPPPADCRMAAGALS